MRKQLINFTIFITLTLMGTATTATPLVSALLAQISQSDYQGYVNTLTGFGSRSYTSVANTNAMTYLTNEFASFGLSVTNNDSYHNVVATLPGLTTPERIFVIGAHFDSVAGSPGADDNASGTAAVLEIASVFSRYQFASTIRFIAFNAEENGLWGSNAYAAAAKSDHQRIIGMFNLDMIAYDGDNANDINLFGDASLIGGWVDNLIEYNLGLTSYPSYTNPQNSDHYWFNSAQYRFDGFQGSSMMSIERGYTPYYHTSGDTVTTLDWDFALRVTKANAATLAELAQAIPEPPVILLLVPGLALAVFRGRRAGAVQGGPGTRR